MIALMPANQYTLTASASHAIPKSGSHADHGALRTRSGRVNPATRAFTPGITHVSSARMMLNHAVAARFNFPDPSGVQPFGTTGKSEANTNSSEIPTQGRLVLTGSPS